MSDRGRVCRNRRRAHDAAAGRRQAGGASPGWFFGPAPLHRRLVGQPGDLLGRSTPSEAIAQLTFGHERSCDPLVVACGSSNVAPSPDGRHVAFTSFADYSPGSLYVSRIDGRGRRRVARLDHCYGGDITWAPDSLKFAYVSNCGPAPSMIYIAKADGSRSRRLSYARNPSW